MEDLVLGIDVGTSSAKGVIADPSGRALWWAQASYRYSSPQPGWAEQEPGDWWRAVGQVTRDLLERHPEARERIAAVGVSGQGAAATLLDRSGRPLRPAILWLDVRSAPQAERLEALGGERIAAVSGKRPAPYNVEPKLIWVRQHEPHVWAAAWKVMTTTAFVVFKLTGEAVMNHSDGGILLAYDLQRAEWSPELLDLMDLPAGMYCRLAPCAQVIGAVTREGAEATGLRPGTPVIAGGEDTSCASLAVGVVSAGEALLSMGTASTLFLAQSRPYTDPRLLAFPHVLPGLVLIGGSMAAGGSAMEWISQLLQASSDEAPPAPGARFADLTAAAHTAPPGAGGVLFLPYLAGELQPINDGFARGVLFGVGLSTGRAHVVRAVMEGVAFAIEHNLTVARERGATASRLVAVGGPTKNDLWCQIIADVTGVPVQVMEERGGAQLGDAALAAMGAGLVDSPLSMVQAHARAGRRYTPDDARNRQYRRLFALYVELYPRLKDLFRRSVLEATVNGTGGR